MFTQGTAVIAAGGIASVQIFHNNAATEWDIYQISVTCGTMTATCIVQINVNGNFVCATPQGSLDTATGPPDIVLNATDVLTINWSNGVVGDQVIANIWYNENPVGTTFSTVSLSSKVAGQP